MARRINPTNPLATTPSRFCTSATNGQPYFFGCSSNCLLFDSCAYHLGWNGSRTTQTFDRRSIPSHDYAIFLINAVKFHCGQISHLFEGDEFMDNMQTLYSKSSIERAEEDSLWLIHFLVILERPARAEFFVRALQLLPDVTAFCKQPIMSTEILCCIAWYYQALDFRHAAHNFIGPVKTVAMNHGMHNDVPVMDLGPGPVQRCRKIWWTVYILDRQMTSLMGFPQSTSDEGVHCQLPSCPGSPLYVNGFSPQSQSPWLEKSNSILEEMIVSGNPIAGFRDNEMQRLAEMLFEFKATQSHALFGFDTAPAGSSGQHTTTGPQTSVRAEQNVFSSYMELPKSNSSQAEDLTTQQIIDVVNSLGWEDNEWMSLIMIEEGG
ncbi:fungal-specific transcription factor domain-containing protein [Colletotrichum caudatum]|nr:fungal-specific transcription factor domain-containing protein [Colletotrichum caudatum]